MAIFDSGFLLVTEAFDCTEAVFGLARDKFFFVDATAAPALDFFVGDAIALAIVTTTLPVRLTAVVRFGADRATAGDCLTFCLIADVLFFTEVFAVFFIAFAIDQLLAPYTHYFNQTIHTVCNLPPSE
ncbi:MAG TPA: hypothetical protein VFA14_03500 [Herbaspirillum sp.]|jgi:hypothetical protein|nr:hypothetical protein [Herbaspirillum sp.]